MKPDLAAILDQVEIAKKYGPGAVGDYSHKTFEWIPALLAYIAELEAGREWISVADRLPIERQVVDVMTKTFGRETDYTFINGKFTYGNNFFVALKSEITHWMPKPLPPLPEVAE